MEVSCRNRRGIQVCFVLVILMSLGLPSVPYKKVVIPWYLDSTVSIRREPWVLE
ncbi:MAG: hypothetical protein M2R45_05394 [Verrucomicrobia subdivision 3 bacterium]|nr:hypothetical protein [Limisphaerales bacterium]MCS1417852.1 hypothetical protein [Limisphaerales bacterium]